MCFCSFCLLYPFRSKTFLKTNFVYFLHMCTCATEHKWRKMFSDSSYFLNLSLLNSWMMVSHLLFPQDLPTLFPYLLSYSVLILASQGTSMPGLSPVLQDNKSKPKNSGLLYRWALPVSASTPLYLTPEL